MEIEKTDMIACLREFGLSEPIREWRLLADGPDHVVPYDVIRKIVYVELENREKYVVKFVREPVFPTQIIERQSAFSDLLLENGIAVPRRLKKDGRYCIAYEKEQLCMDVYAEEWVGEKLPHYTLDICEKTGELLGRIHRIALDTKFQIGFSLLYNEITERDTSFERLWKREGYRLLMPQNEYETMVGIYNRRLEIVKNVWKKLPRAAVQADIYSCNNIAAGDDGGLIVYDFNLAGDEVLIGDILQCWFRTIFDERIEEDLQKLSCEEMWRTFIQAYQRERPLLGTEKQYLPDVYAILGTVYYSKLLNFWMQTGNMQRACDRHLHLQELLETEELPFV